MNQTNENKSEQMPNRSGKVQGDGAGEEPNADQTQGKKQGLWGASRNKSKVQKQDQNQVIHQTRAIKKSGGNSSRQAVGGLPVRLKYRH